MVGRLGLWKSVMSFFKRPPALGLSLPLPVKLQPPCHFSWSSQVRGQPTPGRVSRLLNEMVSVASRLVHAFLQVTDQVCQPMHLSRFMIMAIWAITFISTAPPGSGDELE